MLSYKGDIGLNDKYKFGVEIEFSNINIGYLYKLMKDKFPVKFKLYHNLDNTFDFNKYWCIDKDNSVSKDIGSSDGYKYIGGELSSRILSDNYADWKELKDICLFLRNNGAKVDEKCSSHIHVGSDKFKKNCSFYEYLYKLISVYEDEFLHFYMGDKYFKRRTLEKYARPMMDDLLKIIDKIDFSHYDNIFNTLLYKQYCDNCIKNAMFINDEDSEIEFRYPNGTLDEKIIKNNINFSLKLVDAILMNKFDLDKLNYMIEEIKKNRIICTDDSKYKKFIDLVEIISYNDTDKENFISQYEKVLSTK